MTSLFSTVPVSPWTLAPSESCQRPAMLKLALKRYVPGSVPGIGVILVTISCMASGAILEAGREDYGVRYWLARLGVDEPHCYDLVRSSLDGLVDELELVVLDVGESRRGRAADCGSDQRCLSGAREGKRLHFLVLD